MIGRKALFVGATAMVLVLAAAGTAYAHGRGSDRDDRRGERAHSYDDWHQDRYSDDWDDEGDDDDSSDSDSDDADGGSDSGGGSGVVVDGETKTVTAELTGYSWQDNTPPGSAEICCGVLRDKAGGTGSFADPITTAVPGSGSSMETPAGTRLYIEKLKRYFIVEDSGATSTGKTRFDLWVGGEGFDESDSEACMNSFTGSARVELNPAEGHSVTAGPLTGSGGCNL